jgi:hypothetical protein
MSISDQNESLHQATENKYDSSNNPPLEPQRGDPEATLQHLTDMIPDWNPDSIQYWQKKIMAWAESKGWNQGLQERSFGDWIALLHTEISEAYEDHRNNRGFAEVYYERKGMPGNTYSEEEKSKLLMSGEAELQEFKPCGIPIEMADLAIRLFHLAEYFDFDLAEVISQKMAYNEKRPFRHGGKKL